MSPDVKIVLFSALVATLNPTVLAATAARLLLPHPKRLMLGYLLGAYTTSIASGLVIVFSLDGSSAANSTTATKTREAWTCSANATPRPQPR